MPMYVLVRQLCALQEMILTSFAWNVLNGEDAQLVQDTFMNEFE